jgi:tetratricopeptide (TPR) repeat protein
VIYANDSERDVRRFSEQLERYHAGMALLLKSEAPPPSPSNRVTVYVVRNENAVRKLHGGDNRFVAGFYVPRAGGSLAIVPQVDSGTGQPEFSMLVLLHEYAHHFLISANTMAMPRWLSEGAAEFFASTSFEKNGGIMMGRPAQHRAGELYFAHDVRVEDLLDPTEYEKRPRRSYDAFYGKSWLLYHYLTFEGTRKGQLNRYLALLGQGKSQRDAALEAFGDPDDLERELDRYLSKRQMLAHDLKPSMLKIGAVNIRRLRDGEAAMMPVRIRSRRGVDEEGAAELIVKAREIAARFPDDAAVLSALAEAEYDAGNDKEAIAAADAALAIDPGQVNAYVQKGYALFRKAAEADDQATAYKRARAPFVALNRRENDHPLPLIYYYKSFVEQDKPPPPLAVSGLIRAVELAPFDLGLRMNLATALIRLDRKEEARIALEPVAFNPHGGNLAESARTMLARLDSEPAWKGENLETILASAGDDEEQESGAPPR